MITQVSIPVLPLAAAGTHPKADAAHKITAMSTAAQCLWGIMEHGFKTFRLERGSKGAAGKFVDPDWAKNPDATTVRTIKAFSELGSVVS